MTRPIFEALTTHIDGRGRLTELIHCYNLPEVEGQFQFGQTYTVINERANTIRAFHRHEAQVDFFTVVNGKALVWLVNPEETEALQFILSDHVLGRLMVPERWWHGWMSLEPNTIMICTINVVYNKQNPDEERVPFNMFTRLGVVWEIQPK